MHHRIIGRHGSPLSVGPKGLPDKKERPANPSRTLQNDSIGKCSEPIDIERWHPPDVWEGLGDDLLIVALRPSQQKRRARGRTGKPHETAGRRPLPRQAAGAARGRPDRPRQACRPGADSFTLAVAHREDDRAILDAVYERRPPFSPEAVVAEYCDILRRYNITIVRGDCYAGQWPQEQFRKRGVAYEVADQTASDIYQSLLPALNSGSVELLDDPTLVAQMVGLERRVSTAGRDRITHPDHAHDDVVNAASGALVYAVAAPSYRLLEHLGDNNETDWFTRYQMQTGYGLGRNWHERHRFLRATRGWW